MSLATQIASLAERGAILRTGAFGINFEGTPQMAAMADNPSATFACYFAPINFGELSFGLGFKETRATVLSVAKTETNFSPVIGKKVVLFAADPVDGSDMLVRIVDFVALTSGPSPEFVVECKQEF